MFLVSAMQATVYSERNKNFYYHIFFKRDFNSSAFNIIIEKCTSFNWRCIFLCFSKKGRGEECQTKENNMVDMLVVEWVMMSRGFFIVFINIYVKSLFPRKAGKVMIEYRRNGSRIHAEI